MQQQQLGPHSCPAVPAEGSELLMGLTLTVTCCVEVPIFAINGWILRTLGVHKVLHLTIAVCLIRTVSLLRDVALPCAQLPCCWPECACRQSGALQGSPAGL